MKRFSVLLFLTALSFSAQSAEIEWKVENPYPLFDDPAAVMRLQPKKGEAPSSWYKRMVGDGHINWPRHFQTKWDQEREKFKEGYLDVPSSHKVVAKVNGVLAGQCVWETDLDKYKAECKESVVIDVPYPAGTSLSVLLPDGATIKAQDLVRVDDVVVLGLGDSYGSGEGNPDYPAKYALPNGLEWKRVVGSGRNWITKAGLLSSPAEWLDYRCHRSLYSNQNIVALWLSAQQNNRVVRFVPLACSGAVTSEMDRVSQSSLAETESGSSPLPLKYPQVVAAQKALTHSNGYRVPSIVLLSLGGNDALFGPTISQVLVPAKGRWFVTNPGQKFIRRLLGLSASSANGEYVIKKELASRYLDAMTDVRVKLNLGPSTQVLWTTYADPLERETGEACSLPSSNHCADEYSTGKDRLCRNSAFQVMRLMDGPTTILANPGIVSFELNDVRSRIIGPLQQQVRSSAADIERRWKEKNGPYLTLVDAPERLGKRHGICAVEDEISDTPEDELRWPVPDSNGNWNGISPVDFQAYALRNRWFRTANDSVLIQNRNQSGAIKGWGPRVRGMFHPTAEYHAHLADAIVCSIIMEADDRPDFCGDILKASD